ncbi:hypothetical protein [Corynebacterium sp. ACRQP]|uniref:hypothetical protein n=1 Tax=Corynebacterium sp. ACRQP TaxID=2918195 RepID=UPI001EF47176|nr:hypothetical protein [Corynebacterium sp. ACRQP]MCG7235796.1 hypothetical protein [Corynebacterium sp. ACRQP]
MNYFQSQKAVVAGIASLFILFIGIEVQKQIPNRVDLVYSTFDFESSAPLIGEIGEIRTVLATQVNGSSTEGRWVVIDFSRKADEPFGLRGVIEDSDGTQYLSTFPMSYGCGFGYPGLARHCVLAFEVPSAFTADDVSSSNLLIYGANSKMSPRIVIPIGQVSEEDEIVREGLTI